MSWWRKNGPGEDSVSDFGWVKIKSLWRKNGPGEDSVSVDGWVRLKSAWRHEGNGIWTQIFIGVSIPTPKFPYPDPLFRWPDGTETFDSPINGSSIAAQRGGWTDDPNKFRIRIQKKLPTDTSWTTIWPTDGSIYTKTYTEYLESDDYDLFPSTISNRPVISKADTKAGYSFRTAIEAENPPGQKSSYYYGPEIQGIKPRLDFNITEFATLYQSEQPDGVTLSWTLAPFVNTGTISPSSDIYSTVLNIYSVDDLLKENPIETLTFNSTSIAQYVDGNTVLYPYTSTLLEPNTEYTVELAVTGMDGYKDETNPLDRTTYYAELNFTTIANLPENEVAPSFELISGDESCVDSVYRLNSGTWTNGPNQYRYQLSRINAAGTVLVTHPSVTTFTPDEYYEYTLLSENQGGIDGSVLARNDSGQSKFPAYASNSIVGPISLPKPTGVLAVQSGSDIMITWTPHSSATRWRISWSTSIYAPGENAATMYDEEKTFASWTWGAADKDKNNVVPVAGNQYRFYVSQSVGGTIWSPWSEASAPVSLVSAPTTTGKPTFSIVSGTANRPGVVYRFYSPTWTNSPTEYYFGLENNNQGGYEYASSGWISSSSTSWDYQFDLETTSTKAPFIRARNIAGSSSTVYAEQSIPLIKYEATATVTASSNSSSSWSLQITFGTYTDSADIEWGVSALYGSSASISASGTFTPIGPFAPDTTYYWKVTPKRSTIPGAIVTGTVRTLGQLPTPTASARVSTRGGFYFSIANWDSNNSYVVTTTSGNVSRVQDYVEVTGLTSGQSTVVTVTASRTNYLSAQASFTGTALVLYTIRFKNTYTNTDTLFIEPAGTVISVPNPTRPGGYTISTWRSPEIGGDPTFATPGGSYTVTGNIDFWSIWNNPPTLPTPTASARVSTNGGFYFAIANWSSSNTYTVSTSLGTVNRVQDYVEVTGLTSGQSAVVTVTASRTDYTSSSASFTGTALVIYSVTFTNTYTNTNTVLTGAAGTVISVPNPTRPGGYTISTWRNPQTGGDPVFATPGGSYTISGSIQFWSIWNDPPTLPTPTASARVSTSNGFYFSIANWDSNNTYTVSTSLGTVNRVQDYVEVTGLTSGQSAVVTVTASRTNYTSSSAGFLGTALVTYSVTFTNTYTNTNTVLTGAAGTVISVPNPTRPDGYTISTWRNPQTGGDPVFATPGGSYTISGSIQFWSIWNNPPTLPTPTAGTIVSTSNGFYFSIANWDSNNTYSVSTSLGSVSRVQDFVQVTGLTSGQSAVVTVTASRTNYTSSSAAFTGTAQTQYTVTWNNNDGTGNFSSSVGPAGTVVTAPTPTRAGYTFLYWRNPQSGGDPIFVNGGASYTINSTIQFWAIWQVVQQNKTAPTISSVTRSGTNMIVSFSGGSGPAYQVWWQTSASTPTNCGPGDAQGTSSPITVTNLTTPSSGTTYYFFIRSTSATSTTDCGPSVTASSWSGSATWTAAATPPHFPPFFPPFFPPHFPPFFPPFFPPHFPPFFPPFFPPYFAPALAVPTNVSVSGSGSVTWTHAGADTFTIEFYTAQNGSGASAAGPYTQSTTTNGSYQLTSPYASPNNWARVRVRANTGGNSSAYSAWYPSDTTYV